MVMKKESADREEEGERLSTHVSDADNFDTLQT
jgi:hypothetical protein